MKHQNNSSKKKIRYAVVGLGDIAQVAVLPGFANASANSELTALISDDPKKLKQLSKYYQVSNTCGYDDYDAFLRSDRVDAVYLALPNNLHREFAVRAAKAGIHVLSEKPLAVTEEECHDIIRACAENRVKLMTAYRLHFERANLEAVHILQSGKIGEPRIFQSLFTMQTKPGNIRLSRRMGGGTLYDIGVYCINAARYLFRAEPYEVFAYCASGKDPRFRDVEEMTSAILRFPKDRLASFTTSFGAADAAVYTITGTRGLLRLSQAYEYTEAIEMEVIVDGRTQRRKYALRDQFGPEVIYFSDCILRDREPEPSGIEGLLDVHIIRSLYESAHRGLPVELKELRSQKRPDLRQEIYRPPVKRPPKIHAESPSR
jgi:glucose-fructose oxidoreductase